MPLPKKKYGIARGSIKNTQGVPHCGGVTEGKKMFDLLGGFGKVRMMENRADRYMYQAG